MEDELCLVYVLESIELVRLFVLYYADLSENAGIQRQTKQHEGVAHLSERAFANVSEEREMEQINIAVKVDGL